MDMDAEPDKFLHDLDDREKQFVRFKAHVEMISNCGLKRVPFLGLNLELPNVKPKATFDTRCIELFEALAGPPSSQSAPPDTKQIPFMGLKVSVPDSNLPCFDERAEEIFKRLAKHCS